MNAWLFLTICLGCVNSQSIPGSISDSNLMVAIRIAETLPAIDVAGGISKEELTQATVLEVLVATPRSDLRLKVAGFLLSSVVNDSLNQAISLDENFTVEQKAIIRSAPSGSVIYLEDIKAKDRNGILHRVPSKAILVK